MALAPEPAVVPGFPGGDLRRRGRSQRLRAADREHRSADPRVDRGMRAPLRLRHAIENASANGLKYVRIRGGLSEHLRFFHLTDPAISRKRDIEGQMVKTFAKLRVAEIEPLGKDAAALRHHDRHRRLHRQRRRQPQLLRPADPQVPGLRRRPRLRARDRGQGQCAGAAAGGAGPAVLERGARGTRHEHRPVSVGRGAIQADAGDLGGPARCSQSLLGADEIAAAAAGSAADEGDRGAHRVQRRAVGSDDRREGVEGNRAAHAKPEGALGSRFRIDAGGNPHRGCSWHP